MDTDRVIEYYGSLAKEEKLYTLEEKVIPNTFVLEAPEPFPGFYHYYHEHPVNHKPLYVYLVLDRDYNLEEVTRATQNIKGYFPSRFDAALASVYIHNDTYNVIRVRHFESYDIIEDLQKSFIDEGIKMHKSRSKPLNDEGLIRLRKFFAVKQMSDKVLFDANEADHAYFFIDKPIGWNNFKQITTLVKSNWNKTLFDAGLGYFYVNFKVKDMIRIYDPSLTVADIEAISKLYCERIK
jgi:hypothetical protein